MLHLKFRAFIAAMAISVSLFSLDRAYIKVGGIEGDSKDPEHKGWFEVVAFDQGPYRWTKTDGSMNQMPKESGTQGSGLLTVTRTALQGSPDIYRAVVTGTYLGSVKVDIPVSSDEGNKFVHWELSDVIPTNIHVDRMADRKGAPLEQITFSFKSAAWERPVSSQRKRNSGVQ